MQNDKVLPYPRVCAHRGVHSKQVPENSIPAFERAISLGAQEIEIDLWPSKDGELFVFHNPTIESITGQKTRIVDLLAEDIQKLDIGRGLHIPTFAETLDITARNTILNIHIKSLYANAVKTDRILSRIRDTQYWMKENIPVLPPLPTSPEDVDPLVESREIVPYERQDFQRILDFLDRYECRDYVYIAAEREALCIAQEMAPDIPRCCLEAMNYMTVETAIRYNCQKVQFNKGLTTQHMLDKAHSLGMKCNMFWSNIPEEACAYLDYGIGLL